MRDADRMARVAIVAGAVAFLVACDQSPRQSQPPSGPPQAAGVVQEPSLPRDCTDYWKLGLPLGYMPKVTPTTTLNVRSQPTTESSVSGKVAPGETLFIQKKCSGWFQLAQNSVENRRGEIEYWRGGWVSSKYVCAPRSARQAADNAARTASNRSDQMLPAFRSMFRNAARAQRELGVPNC
ncbi:MAG: SH3 domain-containing protein [Dehalococcoidia bacterium]